MGAALNQKLQWAYRKNAADFVALFGGQFPGFVYSPRPRLAAGEIPVFHFHTVEPVYFAAQLRYLRDNGYATLTCDEYERARRGEERRDGPAVMLTFDDGRASFWSVAYPLLKQYGMRGVCFLIPGYIEQGEDLRPRLSDGWDATSTAAGATADGATPEPAGGTAPPDHTALTAVDTGPQPLCTWREIEAMHADGVVDFQSHTLHHHLIASSSRIVDFCQPHHRRAAVLANTLLPVLQAAGDELFDQAPPLGAPVYASEPRMTDAPRFLDSEALRDRCVEYVAQRGGEAYFAVQDWRRQLLRQAETWQAEAAMQGRFETPAEQYQAILDDLTAARRAIEKRLPGKQVRHLCYPWFLGGEKAVAASREAGHRTNFWGSMPSHYRRRHQEPLFHVPRLEDLYLFRLPGQGRWSLARVIRRKLSGMFASRRRAPAAPHGISRGSQSPK